MRKTLFSLLFILSFNSLAFQIIGEDDRKEITEINDSRFSYIGQILSGCTGTLISPKHVLTAAHCIYSIKEKRYFDNFAFRAGLVGSGKSVGDYNWDKAYILKDYLDDVKGTDFAIISLNEEVEFFDTEKVKLVSSNEGEEFESFLAGYPGDKKDNSLWQSECQVIGNTKQLKYKCDTMPGMSGSSVNKKSDTGILSIIGVHTGELNYSSGKQFNEAVPMSSSVISQLEKWMRGEHGEESVVLNNKNKFYTYNFLTNCDESLELYIGDELEQRFTQGEFLKLSKDEPVVFTSEKNKVYYYAQVQGTRSYFGGKLQLYIDEEAYPADSIVIEDKIFGTLNFTLNCKD